MFFRFDSFSGKGCKRRVLVNHGWVRESFVLACTGSVSSAQVLTLKRARWILESSSLQTERIISSFSLWSPYSQARENKTEEKNKSTEISLNFQPPLHSTVPANVCFPEADVNWAMNHLIGTNVNILVIDNKSSLQVRSKQIYWPTTKNSHSHFFLIGKPH